MFDKIRKAVMALKEFFIKKSKPPQPTQKNVKVINIHIHE